MEMQQFILFSAAKPIFRRQTIKKPGSSSEIRDIVVRIEQKYDFLDRLS
jgi:hypothetical protein